MKTYGISSPISESFPTEIDINYENQLKTLLKEFNLYETEEGETKRIECLRELDILLTNWLQSFSLLKGLNKDVCNRIYGKLLSFGSYRLGVYGKGSDMDLLFIVPRNIEREDFFTSLTNELLKDKRIKELIPIPDTGVPIISFKFNDYQIDLAFSKLLFASIETNVDLMNDNLLKNLDEKSITSLNGYRVTERILQLVPNSENFRTTLRCIKLWAKKRGLYSNIFGYLGGISWALLVARICQLYPNSNASILVSKFFKVYSQWKWPNPILLCEIIDKGFGLLVWNPKVNFNDKRHLMPIITPCYPSKNSSYNVSNSTRNRLIQEFSRGSIICNDIYENKDIWNSLFNITDFFTKYKVYIQILVFSKDEEENRKWKGWIETKIKLFICYLEQTNNIKYAYPFPNDFIQDDNQKNECFYFIGLDLEYKEGTKTIDLTLAASSFVKIINTWSLKTETMKTQITYSTKNKLPNFVKSKEDIEKEKVSKKEPKKKKQKV